MSLRPYTWRQAILKSDLPPTTRHVLMVIACHVNDAGQAACVSTAQLSAESGLSERAVISHLKSVEGKWVGTRRHGYGDKRWARNEYLPRLPDDPCLDVEGTERPSVPPAEIVGEGTERPSVPRVPEGTERHDTKALKDVHPDNGFVLKHYPLKSPINNELLDSPEGELEAWFESEFWKRFPNRKARTSAWRSMRRLKPGPALRREIIAGLDRWLAEREALANARAFVPSLPMPATWINQRRWEDEPSADVPRGTEPSDSRCACGKPGVVFRGKRWMCRGCDPLRQGASAP